MKVDLYKVHIFITILYLAVGVVIGVGFEAIGYANSAGELRFRWLIYIGISAVIFLGLTLITSGTIEKNPERLRFLGFAISSLILGIALSVFTASIDITMLIYAAFTVYLIVKAAKLI